MERTPEQNNVEVKELARQVKEVLDAQQKFFKEGKKPEDLERSKALERSLKKTVTSILNPDTQNKLF